MSIKEIIIALQELAPPSLQESYDNCGLIVGDASADCKAVLTSLDVTPEVIEEAIKLGANLIVAHHPIIFRGLKKINGKDYVEKTVIAAIKNDIAIYAIHTNLDNVLHGVNHAIADKLGLINRQVLSPKPQLLCKLYTFVPSADAEKLREALFDAGAGHIGNYSECSFYSEGVGTFKAGEGTDPYLGKVGEMHQEKEVKVEVVLPVWMQSKVLAALKRAHPYEEVAYDFVALQNQYSSVGSGLIGDLEDEIEPMLLFVKIKKEFGLEVIRHTSLLNRPIKKIALCGGAGSFLVSSALAAGADLFITGDMKYHEFFDANGRMIIADIGHYESEQFTIDLLTAYLKEKFRSFAILKTGVRTNPVHYFTGN